jgi:hypothetical protein
MVQIENPSSTGMETAWNWLDNVTAGLGLFNEKVKSYALAVQKASVKKYTNSAGSVYPGLQNLTPLQLENMALGEYGTGAANIANLQYYTPECMGGTSSKNNVCTCTGGCTATQGWQWTANKSSSAYIYANNQVRSNTNPCPSN